MAEPGARSPLSGRHVLLVVSGGIAAYKAVLVTRLLVQAGAEVQVLMTPTAARFVGPPTFAALTGRSVPTDVLDSPEAVVHVRLAHWADVAVVAPATANTVAKLALGLADDLPSSTILEATCPLVVAPAMHSGMLQHPATQAHLAELAERRAVVVGPAEGFLAAGDEGPGRMSEPEDVVRAVEAAVGGGDLAGRTLLVTAGPTHEPIDPVRFIGNRSTGKMGFAVARAARRRGARVVLVLGPTREPPPDVEVTPVETAEQMLAAVLEALPEADALVMAAAVADWRPETTGDRKLKKESGAPELRLTATPDILKEVARVARDQVVVGFAAETDDLEDSARKKLVDKALDLIVVNEVGRPGTGFGSDTNRAAVLARDGDDVPLRDFTKDELANLVLDRVAALLTERRG